MTSRPTAPRGLAPVHESLANGVTLIVKQTSTQAAVTVSASVAAGSLSDPPGAEGSTHLLSRLLDRGAGTRTSNEVADFLDLRGVSPSISVSRHTTSVTCDCLTADAEAVLALVGDMLRAPTCADAEFQVCRAQVLTGLRQDEESPAIQALDAIMPLLYGEDHPYGRRPKGLPETLALIERSRLLELHAACFTPPRLTLVLVGEISVSAAVSAATRVFGAWEAGGDLADSSTSLPPPCPPGRRRRVMPMPAKAQADIVYGFTTILRSDPAFYAYWVMNNVLGQYGIGGRIGRSLREQQGLAYYAGSSFEAGHIAGPLLVRAGVNGENVDQALASIETEVSQLAREGATEDEVARAKRFLVAAMPRSLETNAGIARFLQTAHQFDLGLDHDHALPDLVDAVTVDAVAEAAHQTLVPQQAAVAIAGPYEAS